MRMFALLLTPLLLAAGCAHDVTLDPAPRANTTVLPEMGLTAVETVSGVKVLVSPSAWPGKVEISEEVTPVKVRVQNNSDSPILFRYSDIRLVSPNGPVYSALPPHAIDATVREPRLAAGYAPVARPGFAATGFGVAPLYSPLYPGYPMAGGGFFYDPLYYGAYGNYWRRVELPTPAMLARALPEGKIEAGGMVDGFLYFEKVSPEVSRVEFRMDLRRAGNGKAIGTVDIPFIVQS